MASSFFTKPFGLSPTPAICFPPPPPPPKGAPTGFFRIVPAVFAVGDLVQIEVEPRNPNVPNGDQVPVIWHLPGIIGIPSIDEFNYVFASTNQNAGGPPGFYTATVKMTWSNGQVRTIPFSYQITP